MLASSRPRVEPSLFKILLKRCREASLHHWPRRAGRTVFLPRHPQAISCVSHLLRFLLLSLQTFQGPALPPLVEIPTFQIPVSWEGTPFPLKDAFSHLPFQISHSHPPALPPPHLAYPIGGFLHPGLPLLNPVPHWWHGVLLNKRPLVSDCLARTFH